MTSAPLTLPAYADAPDANRAGTDASPRLPEWCANFITAIIRLLFAHLFRHHRRSPIPSWWYERPDLPLGSAMAYAASVRKEFGREIAFMCRRRGILPGHPAWPDMARAIVAFGGSIKGARAGLPALGLHWWENPDIIPGMIGETDLTPAADALRARLAREAVDHVPPTEPALRPAAAHDAMPAPSARAARSPAEATDGHLRRASAGAPTGPPIGPPVRAPIGPPIRILHPPVHDERQRSSLDRMCALSVRPFERGCFVVSIRAMTVK